MKKKIVILLSLGFLFSLSYVAFYPLPGSGASDQPIELKFAHFEPRSSFLYYQAITPWADNIEKVCKGKVKIIHYPSETLCKAMDALPAVESGLADISHAPISYYVGRFPLMEVMHLPLLAKGSDPELNTRIAWELYNTIPEIRNEFRGAKLLLLFSFDTFHLLTTKKPVRNLQDLKGMKIRSLGKIAAETLNRLGAVGVTIPISGLYEAASRGVVDGCLNSNVGTSGFRLFEVFHYKTLVPVYPSIVCHVMNEKKFNSLPPDIQKGIEEANGLEPSLLVAREGYGRAHDELLEKMIKESGGKWEVVNLDPGELDKWREIAGKPQWDEWIAATEKKGLPGKKVFDTYLRLIDKYW